MSLSNSLPNSLPNTPLSGLLGGELLSAALGYGLELEPSSLGLFAKASRNPQGAVLEPELEWGYAGSLIASEDFLMDGFEVLAERYAVSQNDGAVTLPRADHITGQEASVGASPSFEAASAQSDWLVDQGGNNLATATNVGWLNGAVTVNDFVGTSDQWDIYSFAVGQHSTINLSLTGMTNDADLLLIRNFNGNQTIETNEILDFSELSGKAAETVDINVGAGFYHVAVQAYGGNTNYSLNMSAAGLNQTQQLVGDLGANRFTLNPAATRSVFSGNGNIDFGVGGLDYIDATSIHSSSVAYLNLAGVNGNSGVAYNDGTGTRIFDALTLTTGQQILFEGMDRIQFADQPISLAVTPNDPMFSQQWNLHMMGVHNAWRFTTGSDEVAIGVADSGLGLDARGNIHHDLQRPDVLTVSGNSEDDFFRNVPAQHGGGPQSSSHGTAVHGVIGARTNNGEGISGINWGSTMINLDVLDENLTDFELGQASQIMINTANSRNEKLIINMSLGANVPSSVHRELEQVISQNPDTLFVIAAGNDGHQLSGLASPARFAQIYDNVMAVGASWGKRDHIGAARTPGQRIHYTYPGQFGQETNWGSQYGPGLTVMGPSEVMSTRASNNGRQTTFGYYTPDTSSVINPQFNGTSAAAPNVSGVASLVWSANSNLGAGQIKQILSETAYRGIPGYNPIEYGSGFVNADAAVRRAIAMA